MRAGELGAKAKPVIRRHVRLAIFYVPAGLLTVSRKKR